jgi:hypothetical protein
MRSEKTWQKKNADYEKWLMGIRRRQLASKDRVCAALCQEFLVIKAS